MTQGSCSACCPARGVCLSLNLDLDTYNIIWGMMSSLHEPNPRKLLPEVYDYLLNFASLTFKEKRPTYYELYLLTKPKNNCDPQLQLVNLAMLMNIMWTELKEFLGIDDYDEDSRNKFICEAKRKKINELEHHVEILMNDPDFCKIKKIANHYGFSTPDTKINLREILKSFGYDRLYLKDQRHFDQQMFCDRRRTNFAATVFANKCNKNWMKKVNLDCLYYLFKSFAFDWYWIKEIEYIDDIFIPSNSSASLCLSDVVSSSEVIINDSDEDEPNHLVPWNIDAFTGDNNGKSICINSGETIHFISSDQFRHNLVQTDEDWIPLSDPLFSFNDAQVNFDAKLTLGGSGAIYVRCNVHPNTMRLKINIDDTSSGRTNYETCSWSSQRSFDISSIVSDSYHETRDGYVFLIKAVNNTPCLPILEEKDEDIDTIFNRVLHSEKLIPACYIPGYEYRSQFKYQVNQWFLAEAVLRYFTWKFLRIPILCNHNLLIQSLTVDQLKAIHSSTSICEIMGIDDTSPAWEVFINCIGDILLSKAVQQLRCCSPDNVNDVPLMMNGNCNGMIKSEIDIDKETLRSWYNNDKNYALVALCDALNQDGEVNVCILMQLIQARITAGNLSNDLNTRSSSIVNYNTDNRTF